MKILLVRNYGTEIDINNYNSQEIGLALALVKSGHTCDILFYTKSKNNPKKEVIKINGRDINIYYKTAFVFLQNTVYLKALKEHFFDGYDVIQSSEYNQIMSVILAFLFKEKVIIYHGPYNLDDKLKKRIYYKIYDSLFLKSLKKNSKSIISKSVLSTTLLENKGFKKIKTLGVGLDENKFNDITYHRDFKSNGIKKILFVGKLDDRKNIPFLLELFKEIFEEDETWQLILVGVGTAKDVDNYKNFVSENKMDNNVFFRGNVPLDRIEHEYRNADIFILPSKEEIFGMVILEAMLFGLPVFTSVNGGSTSLIENQINGFVFTDFNIQGWKEQMISLFRNEVQLLKISRNAHETIINNYTWDKLSCKFIEAYNN